MTTCRAVGHLVEVAGQVTDLAYTGMTNPVAYEVKFISQTLGASIFEAAVIHRRAIFN